PHIVDIPNGGHVAACAEPAPRPADARLCFESGTYAIFLGRLKYRKGVDVLLRALASLPETGKVQLVIVGDGEERPILEALCEQFDVAERVRFLGAVTGPAKTYLLQNARFSVVPSRQWEAFPLVV